jgi:phage shock protein PspC (stress-responsive transcriptional regulator)
MRNEPLTRDVEHQKIAGVCAGIARYFDVDVTLVRAVTAAALLFGPAVVVVYAILWWALDPTPAPVAPPPTPTAEPQPLRAGVEPPIELPPLETVGRRPMMSPD